MSVHEKVLTFLDSVRKAKGNDWKDYYIMGNCYHIFLMLRSTFPSAIALDEAGHIATEINGRCYDITGELMIENRYPLTQRSHNDYMLRYLFEILNLESV
jgi:hypothetical protein